MNYNKVHDIYDVILKIIILIWGTFFLKFIGVDGEIKEVLKTELVTGYGKKAYIDFLCRLKNNKLLHFEFEFPSADNNDLNRFHFYNCIIRFYYEGELETIVFNFTSKRNELLKKIGQGISFHPPNFNLSDINFDEHLEKINIKVNTNKKLTGIEEIVLMLRCLVPSFHDKTSTLKNISKLLHKKELFDDIRFQYFEAIIMLEIHNLIPQKDCEEIIKEIGEIKMTPQAESTVNRVVTEINDKILYQTHEDGREQGIEEGIEKGREQGIEEGIEKGREQGRDDALLEVAFKLKDLHSDEEIAKITGLSIDTICNL